MKHIKNFKLNENLENELLEDCPSYFELENRITNLNITLKKIKKELSGSLIGAEEKQPYIMEYLMGQIDF